MSRATAPVGAPRALSRATARVPRRKYSSSTRARASKFPAVDFDGLTPEDKAARALVNLFTMAATRVILDQMSGTRHRSPMFNKIVDYLQEHPLRNGNEWLAQLMAHEELDYRLVAVRIIETRKALADTEFDYEHMKEATLKGITEENLDMTREYLWCSLDADEHVDDLHSGGSESTGS